jgi:hypothetical protein
VPLKHRTRASARRNAIDTTGRQRINTTARITPGEVRLMGVFLPHFASSYAAGSTAIEDLKISQKKCSPTFTGSIRPTPRHGIR